MYRYFFLVLISFSILEASMIQKPIWDLTPPNEMIAEKTIGKTKIILLTGDLLNDETSAIVNAANAHLAPGGGICGAIYKHAGAEVFTECKTILSLQNRHSLNSGEAALTTAGLLCPKIQVIAHAVGPDCRIPNQDENRAQLLHDAYTNSLTLVTDPRGADVSSLVNSEPLRTISFPSISTGIYKFPLAEAAPIALGAVKDFILNHPDALDEVRFVFWPLDKDRSGTLTFYLQALEKLD